MNTELKIAALENLMNNPVRQAYAKAKEADITAIEESLMEDLKPWAEKFWPLTVRRHVIAYFRKLIDDTAEALKGHEGADLVVERLEQFLVVWREHLFTWTGLEFQEDNCMYDVERKKRDLLRDLLITPEFLKNDLSGTLAQEKAAQEVQEVIENEEE